jgi:hypothetical protein
MKSKPFRGQKAELSMKRQVILFPVGFGKEFKGKLPKAIYIKIEPRIIKQKKERPKLPKQKPCPKCGFFSFASDKNGCVYCPDRRKAS